MSTDSNNAVVRALPSQLSPTHSGALVRRGLRDIEATEQSENKSTDQLARKSVSGIQRKRISEITEEEKYEELLTSYITRLPSFRAFLEKEQDGPATAYAVSTLDWELFPGGSQKEAVAIAKAEALRAAGLEAYHDQTPFDMFLYRGGSQEDLRAKLERAREILRTRTFETSERKTGVKRTVTEVGFTFGIGRSLTEADAADLRNQGGRNEGRAAHFLMLYR